MKEKNEIMGLLSLYIRTHKKCNKEKRLICISEFNCKGVTPLSVLHCLVYMNLWQLSHSEMPHILKEECVHIKICVTLG